MGDSCVARKMRIAASDRLRRTQHRGGDRAVVQEAQEAALNLGDVVSRLESWQYTATAQLILA